MSSYTTRKQAKRNLNSNNASIEAFSQSLEALNPLHMDTIPDNNRPGRLNRIAHRITEVAGIVQSVVSYTIREGSEAEQTIKLYHAQQALDQGAVTESQLQILRENGQGGQICINMADNWTR